MSELTILDELRQELEQARAVEREISAVFASYIIENKLHQVEQSQEPITNADGVDRGFANVWEGSHDDENVIITQFSDTDFIFQGGKQSLLDLSLDYISILESGAAQIADEDLKELLAD